MAGLSSLDAVGAVFQFSFPCSVANLNAVHPYFRIIGNIKGHFTEILHQLWCKIIDNAILDFNCTLIRLIQRFFKSDLIMSAHQLNLIAGHKRERFFIDKELFITVSSEFQPSKGLLKMDIHIQNTSAVLDLHSSSFRVIFRGRNHDLVSSEREFLLMCSVGIKRN